MSNLPNSRDLSESICLHEIININLSRPILLTLMLVQLLNTKCLMQPFSLKMMMMIIHMRIPKNISYNN